MHRIFVGWNRPLAESAAEWLWERRDQLGTMCLVVPTAQAGRRLREAVAAHAAREKKAVLGLRTVTPAYFIKVHEPEMADDAIELLAWMEVLESIGDWSPYAAAFPHEWDEEEGKGWSRNLAQSLVALRYQLQEAGTLIRDAARRMSAHADAPRWQALVLLEQQVEALLRTWSLRSRSACLYDRLTRDVAPHLPNDCTQLVLIGVTETTPLVAQLWQRLPTAIALIAAPAAEEESFDDLGFPAACWCQRAQEFPGRNGISGQVHVVTDLRQLAEKAVECIAVREHSSDQVMLATCDPSLGRPLAAALERAGWPVFDPSASLEGLNWRAWLRHWLRWLSAPTLDVVMEMAGFRETESITGGPVFSWLRTLGILRDQCLVESIDDIQRFLAADALPRGVDAEKVQTLLAALQHLQRWRAEFFQQGCCPTLIRLIERWQSDARICVADVVEMIPLLEQWSSWEQRLGYDAALWLQLFCDRLPPPAMEMPDARALDVEGWLEIAFHSSAHLLVCGMSDQFIPAACGGEPWLNSSNRLILGLNTDARREARDAYLYHAMIETHRGRGAIDVILSKSHDQGAMMLPSRLLLRASGTELAERVACLFAELPTADSHSTWHRDWQWQPRFVELPPEKEGTRTLSVTALRDYLNCPYRFYLRHGLRMNVRDSDRGEWNHRDFGNLLHEVLEQWGRDEVERDLADAAELTRVWHGRLHHLLLQRYGEKPNLALQIQIAALRQRLEWLAEKQAAHRAEGWQIVDVEKSFVLPGPLMRVSGKIDRMDIHESSGECILWDYKTGAVKKQVSQSHLTGVTARSVIPSHLANDDRLFWADEKGKTQRWTNLQLPLYAAAGLTPQPPMVGYITIGDSRDQVSFLPWEGFHQGIAEAACACAHWLIERIDQRMFWPPNEKSFASEFDMLACGDDMENMSSVPPVSRP